MFWDSSAIIPVLIAEARSARMLALLASDRAPALWWAGPVECQSALHRRRREKALSAVALADALVRLARLVEDVDVVTPKVRLRAGEGFVCLDDRLREAAAREAFQVLPELL